MLGPCSCRTGMTRVSQQLSWHWLWKRLLYALVHADTPEAPQQYRLHCICDCLIVHVQVQALQLQQVRLQHLNMVPSVRKCVWWHASGLPLYGCCRAHADTLGSGSEQASHLRHACWFVSTGVLCVAREGSREYGTFHQADSSRLQARKWHAML
jgi:hypothetical protein